MCRYSVRVLNIGMTFSVHEEPMTKSQLAKIWSLTSGLFALTMLLWFFFMRTAEPLSRNFNAPVLLVIAGVMLIETEWFTMRLSVGKEDISYSLSEIPMLVGLLYVNQTYFVPLFFVGIYVVGRYHAKNPVMKAAFNASIIPTRFALTWGILTLMTQLKMMDGVNLISPVGWVALVVACFISSLFQNVMITTVIYLASGLRSDPFTIKSHFMNMVASVQGVLLVFVIAAEPLAIILFLVSMSVFMLGSKAYVQESNQRISAEERAETDPLTGLKNRSVFDTVVSECVENDDPCAIAYIDLDNFKTVNDDYGHHSGDLVLIETGTRLSNAIRSADVAIRIGGDEFAVIFGADTNPHIALGRITEALNADIVVNGTVMPCGASIGFALRSAGETKEEFLARADRAMYVQKDKHKATEAETLATEA